jgi:hypothetical protein
MKISTIAFFLSFICLFTINMGFSQQPIAYYNFNNGLQDLSGNNNHGKGFGTISYSSDRFGNNCSAVSLNGSDAFIEVSHTPIFDNIKKGFSVSCWFKLKGNPTNSSKWVTILCKGDIGTETDNNPHFRSQIFQGDAQSTISINTDFTENDTDFKNHLIEFDKWYFSCITYDGQDVKAYLNEQLIWKYPYNKELKPNTSPLFIGKDIPGAMELFNGDLDELRIFDYSLTENEVLKIKRSTELGSYLKTFDLNCPKNSIVNNSPTMCFAKVDFDKPSISSTCLDVKLKQIKGLSSGSNFPAGNSTVVFQAQSNGNEIQTCISNITVIDKEAPVFTYMKDTTITIPLNTPSVKINYAEPKVSDNCKVKKVWLDEGIASGKDFPLGATKVVYKAVDENENTATFSFIVNVVERKKAVSIDSVNLKMKSVTNTSLGTVYYEHNTLITDSCTITIQIYDNGEQDNDTVSVFFNKEEIETRRMLKLKENGTIIKTLTLIESVPNDLVFYALNTGKSGLNTMKVEFYYGDFSKNVGKLKLAIPFAAKEFNSKPGLSSAIILKCK